MATFNPELPENSPKNAKKQQLKLNYKFSGVRFPHLACQGRNSPLCPRQLRHWWLWYIVFTYSKLSLLNSFTIFYIPHFANNWMGKWWTMCV